MSIDHTINQSSEQQANRQTDRQAGRQTINQTKVPHPILNTAPAQYVTRMAILQKYYVNDHPSYHPGVRCTPHPLRYCLIISIFPIASLPYLLLSLNPFEISLPVPCCIQRLKIIACFPARSCAQHALRCATAPPLLSHLLLPHASVPARSAAAKLLCNRCYHTPGAITPPHNYPPCSLLT